MKWGVRKQQTAATGSGYRSHSPRAALARHQNKKVDKGFKKWKENSMKRESAIELGKKANTSRMAYDQNRRDKNNKRQYKQDKKAYKAALRANTTYRKGQIRGEVGKDASRKYMSAAKKALKAGDQKTYSKFMNTHDIERAKARKAPMVGAKRSQRKATIKRSITVGLKSAAAAAAISGGTYVANRYLSKHGGVTISPQHVQAAANVIKKGKKFMQYFY